ncbi:MAG TPA: DinB family protein [Flavobacterium sp.]|nr:DinB family protein [Flavobacterium sp.]
MKEYLLLKNLNRLLFSYFSEINETFRERTMLVVTIFEQTYRQIERNNMENSTTITDAIWTQFGASLDMLENAINMCPDEHWDTALDFWYLSFHCIFWTDYYLSTEPNKFAPPKPFTLSEFDPTGKKPERTYTKPEVLNYLEYCRQKANQFIEELTPNRMNDRWINEYKIIHYLKFCCII